jgi:hypothetical protein
MSCPYFIRFSPKKIEKSQKHFKNISLKSKAQTSNHISCHVSKYISKQFGNIFQTIIIKSIIDKA